MLHRNAPTSDIEKLERFMSQIRAEKQALDQKFGFLQVPYQHLNEPKRWKETAFNPKVFPPTPNRKRRQRKKTKDKAIWLVCS